MSKKRKQARMTAVKPVQVAVVERVPPQTPAVRPEQHEQTQVQVTKRPWRAEYVLQQWYEIVVDEDFIEKEWVSGFAEESRPHLREHVDRFKRMLRGIAADSKALDDVCTYLTLAEQDFLVGDETYVEEHYEERTDFLDILMRHFHCFTKEDGAWLRKILKYKGSDEYDTYTQLEGLRKAFSVSSSGFAVGRYQCNCGCDG